MTRIAKAKDHSELIIISKNNPEQGSVKVISETPVLNSKGFLNISTRSALLKGSVADLSKMNFKEGQVVPYKIVIKESTTEFFAGQEPKKYPENHAQAGEVITHMGAPVYVNKLVVAETSEESDLLLAIDREPVATAQTQVNSDFIGKEITA
jgi:hypothetical protein